MSRQRWGLAMTIKRTLSAAVIVLGFSMPAAASVQSDMQSFLNDIGGYGNVTAPSAHIGQEAGFYTGGSLFLRTPQKNSQMLALQMPSFRAGCGGIDAFTGAFSFLNSGELIQLFKSIASSAVGFAFKLALETISPVIAETVGELQDLINRINQANISSCEAAQGLVGSIWPKTDLASKSICQTLGNSSGLFSDYASSKHGCGSEGRRTEVLNGASGPERKFIPVDKNLTWEAIKHNNLLSSLSFEEKQLWMTLAGTMVIRKGTNDDQPVIEQKFAPKGSDLRLIQALMRGESTAVQVHRCNDPDDCLSVTANGLTITLTPTNSFYGRTENMLLDMVTKIQDREAMTTEQQALLNLTALPVYKILNVYTAYSVQQAYAELPKLAELVSLDVILAWIGQGMREVEKASATVHGADQAVRQEWMEEISKTRLSLNEMRDEAERRIVQQATIVEKARVIEGILNSRFSGKVGGAVNFAKAMKRGS